MNAYVLNVPIAIVYTLYFLDHAISKHLIYFFKIHDVTVPGTKVKRTFSIKTRGGRPKNTPRALIQE